jgi:6-phosphogluconolactonase
VAVYLVNSDGSIGNPTNIVQHKGSGKNPDRQEAPHAHSVILDSSNKYAFVSDLGIDRIMIYKFNSKTGILTPANIPWVSLQPGAGPRHFTFHPNGKNAYIINELNSTISCFSYESKDGKLTEIQTITTLPANSEGNNSCADIHISPSGKYLYGSNRGHNSIVCYSIDKTSGKLTLVGFESTRGETPRNFSIDPSGTFLLVANQNSNTIVTFRIDSQTGKLNFTEHILKVPSPVCIKFLE